MNPNSQPPTNAIQQASTPAPIGDYATLQAAFDHFNRDLFEGGLPQVLLAFKQGRRHKGKYRRSFFRGETFESRTGKHLVDEIALNPITFEGRTDEEILSTLAHEMVHLWQTRFGKPGPEGYHNREWVRKMLMIGLCPTDTGLPGGKQTGPKMEHVVVEDGAFQKSARSFLPHHSLGWQSPALAVAPPRQVRLTTPKSTPAPTLTCPKCGQSTVVEGTQHRLKCGYCESEMTESFPEPGMLAWILKLIRTARMYSDHEIASKLFDDACAIYRHAPEAVFNLCAGIVNGIGAPEEQGWTLKKRAADWIIDFLKNKNERTLWKFHHKLLEFDITFYGESIVGDDSGMINDYIVPTLDSLREKRQDKRRLGTVE